MTVQTLSFEIEVASPVAKVWDAWTTVEGIRGFFSPECRIELIPGGAYEMYFLPDAPAGAQGSDGCRILAIEEQKMLSFTWNAPPEFPDVRRQQTHMCLRLNPLSGSRTLVTLTQDGWGESEEWQKVRDYFKSAWGEIVLPRLKQFVETGSVD